MVIGYLPNAGFPLINVCDPMLDGYVFAGKLESTILDARFEGHIANDADDLILQMDFPVRGQLSRLLERLSDCISADLPTADRVYGYHGLAVRPDVCQ